MSEQRYFDANRKLWNTRSGLHLESRFYDVPAFRAGQSSLCGIELKEVGPVAGKSILHLQCHFGLDSLSLAREGATVTGVDFSDAAIESARALADELDLRARFICCNVLDLPDYLTARFDIVFTTLGVVGWLPDLNRWAELIHEFLQTGGTFYLLEFHPQFMQRDERGELTYDYFGTGEPDAAITDATYADGAEHAPLTEYWWNHTLGDIVSALLGAGMRLTLFHEFPFSAYKLNDSMVEVSPGRWVDQQLGHKIPYMFSLKAERVD